MMKRLLVLLSVIGLSVELHAQYAIEYILGENESVPDSSLVLAAPGNGAFLLKRGRELISLEHGDILPAVKFPESFVVEDATFTDAFLYVKNGKGIYNCSESLILIMAFDTENFHILPTADNNLFVFTYDIDAKALYALNCQNKDVCLLARFPDDVVYAYGTLDEAFVVAGKCIYLLSDHKTIKLLDFFDPIIAAAQTETGLYFGTEKELLLFIDKDTAGLVEELNCKQLVSSDGRLLVYKKDGSLQCYQTNLVE